MLRKLLGSSSSVARHLRHQSIRNFYTVRPLFEEHKSIIITSSAPIQIAAPTLLSTDQTPKPVLTEEEQARKKKADRVRGLFDTIEKYKYVTSVLLLSCLTATGMLLYWLDERFFKHVGDKSSGVFRGIYRSSPKKQVKTREVEEKELREVLMKNRDILVVVGAQDSGKTTLVESVLSDEYYFRVVHVKMAQINDTASFAETLRQALSTSESVERFLLNTIFTKREELAKQHQLSNADPITKVMVEFAQNVSNPSHVLNIDLLNTGNPNRQTVLFIDDFDTLLTVLNGAEDKELRSKLIALFQIVGRAHGIKLVVASSQGEVNKLIAAGKAENMTEYFTLNGLRDYEQSKEFFKFFSKDKGIDSESLEKLCAEAYTVFKGDIAMWKKLAYNPTFSNLNKIKSDMNDTIKIIKARKMPRRGLFAEPQWTDQHIKYIFSTLTTRAQGKPCYGLSDSNVGIIAFDLEKAGIPWSSLQSLCHYNVLCYNPETHNVTFASSLMQHQATKHPELWS
jgi:hypothetical protein